jgi:hypothetical protein
VLTEGGKRLDLECDVKARTYSVLSHLGTMLFAQHSHALSLNGACDWLRLKVRAIAAFGLTPPSRNNLSNSNKVRDAKFAELVFWRTRAHLQHHDRSFGRQRPGGNAGRSLLPRFKMRIHAVDSTVVELVANCMNWAKHRRRKAAAKMHLRLGLNSFLPTFAIVDTAGEHDNKRAREVCAGLDEGEADAQARRLCFAALTPAGQPAAGCLAALGSQLQRQRHPLAGMDRTAALRAVALRGAHWALGAQFYAPLRGGPRSDVGCSDD